MIYIRRLTVLFGLVLLGLSFGTSSTFAQQAQTHTVKAGETLYRVSQMYDISVDSLRKLNGLTGNSIQVGQKLRVAAQPAPEPPPTDTTAAPKEDTSEPEPEPEAPAAAEEKQPRQRSLASSLNGGHVVQPGETLYSIAARYDITADSLLVLNRTIDPGKPLAPGQELALPVKFQTSTYTVRSGNTLGRIAKKYGVSLTAIRQANNLQSNQIRVGQQLTIPSRAVPEPAPKGALGKVDTSGAVHIYAKQYAGRLTASGEPYAPEAFTASHPSLPFGSVLLLENSATGQSSFVRVNDRGPIEPGVLIDISAAAARALGLTPSADQPVDVRRVQ